MTESKAQDGGSAAGQSEPGKYPSQDNYLEQAKIIVSLLTTLQKVIITHMRKSESPDKTRNQVLGQVYAMIGNILKETI